MTREFNKLNYMQILRDARLTHAQYRVLATLLTYADPDGTNAHPGYTRLTKECRMSRGTVSDCIAHLKRSGWLWESARGWPTKGGWKASVYELRVPEYFDSGVFAESNTRSVHINTNSDAKKASESCWG